MGIERKFLGWDGPVLERACGALFDLAEVKSGGGDLAKFGALFEHVQVAGSGIDADFSDFVVVTPGARSGRLLLGLMVDRAAAMGLALSPPMFVTPGELPGAALGPLGKVAGPVQRRLAWVRAIQACAEEEVRALLPGKPGDMRGLSGVASLLEKAHDALIGEGIRFEEVQVRAGGLDEPEASRWMAAAAVQTRYEKELASVGLVDDGLAQLAALSREKQTPARRIVLVGVSELGAVARRALDGLRVTSLIAAPKSVADTLDELGCVTTSKWCQRRVDLAEDSITFAAGPEDQAYKAMEAIAKLNGRYAPHQIAIAVPDDEVIPKLERAAERYGGVQARPAAGVPLSGSSVVQLLRAIKRLREEGSFESLASLVRHPDVERCLLRSASLGPRERWLAVMDKYAREAVPAGASDGELRIKNDEERRQLDSVTTAVRRLLARLDVPGPKSVLEVMIQIYAGQHAGREDRSMQETIRACEMLRDALVECMALPEEWAPPSSEELIGLLLDVLASKRITVDASPDAIELLGWLELPLDPSPAAIVTGVNDGRLPESFGSDPFLPDGLREKLGIACSTSRMARDAFLMSVVVHSRPAVNLVCARAGADGDPLLPSRLLFATDDRTVLERVWRFVDPKREPRPSLKLVSRLVPGGLSGFEFLPMGDEEPRDSMRVTSFRTFLESPYLFYLRDVLCLQEFEPRPPELDRMQFGVLIHDVLQAWGESDRRDSTDQKAIRSVLRDGLATLAQERFGPNPAVAVALQVEIAAARLDAFAVWQAGRRESGWRVEQVEWKPKGLRVPLPGLPFEFHIRGKIDRIDRHDDGSVAILDYKTGDNGDTPEKTHGGRDKWRDLQLPLYRHLAAEIGLPSDPEKLWLGYVNLPRKAAGEYFLKAGWELDVLDNADAKAREVATRVRERDFAHLGPKPPTDGAFAALCGTAFPHLMSLEEEDEE